MVARNVPSDFLALVSFFLGVRKGKWKGTGMIGEGTRREGIGKYNYYHCQRLHVKFIMHKTQSSIQAIKLQSADASRPFKEHSTVTLSDVLTAVSVHFEEGKQRIERANGKECERGH